MGAAYNEGGGRAMAEGQRILVVDGHRDGRGPFLGVGMVAIDPVKAIGVTAGIVFGLDRR